MAKKHTPSYKEIASRVPELREKFQAKYAEELKDGTYDSRDVDRLMNEEAYAKCFVRSFSEKGDLEKPVENINTIFKFRKELEINDLKEDGFPADFEDRHFLYWKGVDKDGRKILHFKVANHKKGQQIMEVKKYISFFLDRHHKAEPGVRIVLIFDFTDAGLTNMDLDVVRFIITSLSTYFPSILGYILLFEMPWLLSSVWKIIRSWLDEEQKRKIMLVKRAEIQTYINADELEPHMVK